MLVNKALT